MGLESSKVGGRGAGDEVVQLGMRWWSDSWVMMRACFRGKWKPWEGSTRGDGTLQNEKRQRYTETDRQKRDQIQTETEKEVVRDQKVGRRTFRKRDTERGWRGNDRERWRENRSDCLAV